MNQKKLYKKLHNLLISIHWLSSRQTAEEFSKSKYLYKQTRMDYLRMLKIHDIFDELGFTDEERDNYYKVFYFNRRQASMEYKKMPKPPRKDNKTHINYGSGGGFSGHGIRYPRKVRKTAWKRFYKLFPHLKKKE